jgi:hypothetical protein
MGRNVAEIFKTPGKLRGKTPRTVRKGHLGENRVVSVAISILTVERQTHESLLASLEYLLFDP